MATHAPSLAAAARSRRGVLVVAVAALAAALAVVGVTLLQTRGQRTSLPGAVTKPQPGWPQLQLAFFDLTPTATDRALARAQKLYGEGAISKAATIFGRYHSVEAQIGSAFAAWSDGKGLATLKQLSAQHPQSAVVALHLGWAYYWMGRNEDAVETWQQAAKLQPDGPYGVEANDILHSVKIPGLPPIETGLAPPASIAKLPATQQVAALRRAAVRPDERAKLLYGSFLWTLERPVSAERQFAAAAKLAPHDPVARVAAAVGLFSQNPTRAFGKLGPLTAVFPHSAVVEFHLGVLLLYIGENGKAAKQLRAAVQDGPRSPYAKPASTLLASLARNGSK